MTGAQTRLQGEVLLALSNEIIGVYKELYGKGPVKVRTRYLDDMVVCVLRGGLTRSEHAFVEEGHGDRVALQRSIFHEATKPVFMHIVEELTGRYVETALASTDEERDVSVLTFLLEPQGAPAIGRTEEALLRQGKQVRRRTAELREESRALREKYAKLRDAKR